MLIILMLYLIIFACDAKLKFPILIKAFKCPLYKLNLIKSKYKKDKKIEK